MPSCYALLFGLRRPGTVGVGPSTPHAVPVRSAMTPRMTAEPGYPRVFTALCSPRSMAVFWSPRTMAEPCVPVVASLG
jgi:hypothetical protein